MEDNELYELCKQVYKNTKWKTNDYISYDREGNYVGIFNYPTTEVPNEAIWSGNSFTPLYTSDFLLEKLPKTAVTRIDQDDYKNPEYVADSFLLRDRKRKPISFRADTPLKALLKLTLSLHEAGELKAKD